MRNAGFWESATWCLPLATVVGVSLFVGIVALITTADSRADPSRHVVMPIVLVILLVPAAIGFRSTDPRVRGAALGVVGAAALLAFGWLVTL